MQRKRIMFICTGNAFRSQMAEGFARYYGGDQFEVHSAGVVASGLHPRAVEAMAEINIDISQQTSKQIDFKLLQTMDYVVTVCDHAKEHCPAAPGAKRVVHWSIDDPLRAIGTEVETRELCRVRDDLGRRVMALIDELSESSPLCKGR